ncbi:hypothetical protein BT63DRAFT_435337 [Microthyrium microscopicum]|uniref:SnoaL-like domain-containing protein n=1 Tax=Microthyrium microscopicum TaxID=703497 RepID=A0A6A6UPH6_9PEZI|nr:hypothetical protein BT63DRAFT_435337 [Microthyrium microscopicum]
MSATASMPTAPSMPSTLATTSTANVPKPLSSPSPQWSRSAMLRKCAHAFCMALRSSEFNAHTFVSTFFVEEGATIIEHGPNWARKKLPFLGQTFEGREGCVQYFERLGHTLRMKLSQEAFPPDDELCVDPDTKVAGLELKGMVCVTGKGHFEHRGSGWSWNETFIYRLCGFDEDGRIARWEIWADPLSAWEAANISTNGENNGDQTEAVHD